MYSAWAFMGGMFFNFKNTCAVVYTSLRQYVPMRRMSFSSQKTADTWLPSISSLGEGMPNISDNKAKEI